VPGLLVPLHYAVVVLSLVVSPVFHLNHPLQLMVLYVVSMPNQSLNKLVTHNLVLLTNGLLVLSTHVPRLVVSVNVLVLSLVSQLIHP